MQFFGWQITRKTEEQPSFAPPANDDGATIVQAQQGPVGGSYGTYLDLDNTARTEAELVNKYRGMALAPEVRAGIDNIVNEAIVIQKEKAVAEVDLGQLDLPENVKQAIQAEFATILKLLHFKTKAYDVFRAWYVDGRLYFHCIIDKDNPGAGIQELRWLDPRKTKKVKEVKEEKIADVGGKAVKTLRVVSEYFVYNERGFDGKQDTPTGQPLNDQAIKIAKDTIAHVTSGLLDESGRVVYSYLHDAIRPLNMFRTISDSAIIYRLVRAPQRRVFYIDVGDLPKHKAEQYVNDMMTKYKNKLVFDPMTGAMKDDRKHMTMLEDFWLSRREGGRGTQIDTLDGAANWGVMEEVQFFLKMLYKSLHVPLSRLDPEYIAPLGRAGEITREEVDFAKFVDRIRSKFCELFLTLLERQLILKGVMTPEDWESIKHDVDFDWAKDNYFAELKELSVATERFNTLSLIQPFIGRFVSNEWVRRKMLFQTDEEFDEINAQIAEERQDPLYAIATDPMGQPLMPVDMGLNVPEPDPNMLMPPEQQDDTQALKAQHDVDMFRKDLDHTMDTLGTEKKHDKEVEGQKTKFGDLQQKYRELKLQHTQAKGQLARAKASAAKKKPAAKKK